MTNDEILGELRRAIEEETGSPRELVTMDSRANMIPGWDSLAHVRIIMNLEARLGAVLDMDATYRAANVSELIDIVKAVIPGGG